MAILKGNGSILSAFGELLTDSAAARAFKSGTKAVFSSGDRLGKNTASSLAARAGLNLGKDEASTALRNKFIKEARQVHSQNIGRKSTEAANLINQGRKIGAGTIGMGATHWLTAADHVGSADRWKNIAARAGVTAAGVGVASRLMSGGTLTHDKEGRFNVAGLPFI
jgi:hypothetical protein